MSITIVIEVSLLYGTNDCFTDSKACLRALLSQMELATPDHPLPREGDLSVTRGPKLGHYAVYFPIKSRSVMELIKATHDGTDLTPIDTTPITPVNRS
jgi:hypothetical protein